MIGLSKSSLSTFKNCARCFYLEKNKKIGRPRGIMASIMKGIDREMKNSVESAITRGADHSYLADFPGAQPFRDRLRLKKFMSWQTFQAEVNGIKLWGELDDLIEFPDRGLVAPWDFKSNGSERDWLDYATRYYQLDGDMYHLILEKGQGLKCTGKSYLTFTWPSGSLDNAITFSHKTIEVDTDPQRAVQLAVAAVACLSSPIVPAPGVDCEYCPYVHAQMSLASQENLSDERPGKPVPSKKKGSVA